MKIKAIDKKTKQPAKYQRILLQIKGKDSGFLTVMSDAYGEILLDEKYKDQQIALSGQSQYIQAKEGATLIISHDGQMAGGKTGAQGKAKDKNKETWK